MTAPVQRSVTVRYFAALREKIGVAEEILPLPAAVLTVQDLMTLLKQRGDGYERAFAEPRAVRVALDHVHARPGAPIGHAREVAFFPPVTGG